MIKFSGFPKKIERLLTLKIEFPTGLQTFRLYKLLNSLIYAGQRDLAFVQKYFIDVKTKTLEENEEGGKKEEFDFSWKLPTLNQYKEIVKNCIEFIEISDQEIELIFSFAKTIDKMPLSNQINTLTIDQFFSCLFTIFDEFIDFMLKDGNLPKVNEKELEKKLLQNLESGNPLNFRECILLAAQSE